MGFGTRVRWGWGVVPEPESMEVVREQTELKHVDQELQDESEEVGQDDEVLVEDVPVNPPS